MTTVTHFECSRCGRRFEPGQLAARCPCGGPLLVRYNLEAVRQGWSREWLEHAPPTMWRYAPLLPASGFGTSISLGEGMTPLVRLPRIGERAGVPNLWIKDDGVNPAGSAESRAASCWFTMALQMGLSEWQAAADAVAAPALALYGAAAGLPVRLALPASASRASWLAVAAAGALADGAALGPSAEAVAGSGAWPWPYRVEGLKTLGLEIAEQMRWNPPSAILCPAGDGAGLVGIWKAFEELAAIGWLTTGPPRLFAVQAEGCAPLVDAFHHGLDRCAAWPDPRTIAASLRTPLPDADDLVLRILRFSGGGALAVSDEEMLDAAIELAQSEGIFASPEGGASLAALRRLREDGALAETDSAVLVNPASGFLYPEVFSTRFPRSAAGEQDKLGGLITPR
ncbi:MAG: threonine synthase [Bryobacteraceae bacterium]|nr:threonine synthase [Bryobacteraceae bacterium]